MTAPVGMNLTDADLQADVLLLMPAEGSPPIRWPTRPRAELVESAQGLAERSLDLLEIIENCIDVMPDLGGRAGVDRHTARRKLQEVRALISRAGMLEA